MTNRRQGDGIKADLNNPITTELERFGILFDIIVMLLAQ
jgi:hypothetical protein